MIYKFRLLSDEVDNFRRDIEIDSEATFLELEKVLSKLLHELLGPREGKTY